MFDVVPGAVGPHGPIRVCGAKIGDPPGFRGWANIHRRNNHDPDSTAMNNILITHTIDDFGGNDVQRFNAGIYMYKSRSRKKKWHYASDWGIIWQNCCKLLYLQVGNLLPLNYMLTTALIIYPITYLIICDIFSNQTHYRGKGRGHSRDSYPEFPDVIIPIDDSRSPTEHYNSDWQCTKWLNFSRLFSTQNHKWTDLLFFGNQTILI